MLRRCSTPLQMVSHLTRRPLTFTPPTDYYKRNFKGVPFNGIAEWIDEGVDIGFLDARTTIRSQQFKKQPRKNVCLTIGSFTTFTIWRRYKLDSYKDVVITLSRRQNILSLNLARLILSRTQI